MNDSPTIKKGAQGCRHRRLDIRFWFLLNECPSTHGYLSNCQRHIRRFFFRNKNYYVVRKADWNILETIENQLSFLSINLWIYETPETFFKHLKFMSRFFKINQLINQVFPDHLPLKTSLKCHYSIQNGSIRGNS